MALAVIITSNFLFPGHKATAILVLTMRQIGKPPQAMTPETDGRGPAMPQMKNMSTEDKKFEGYIRQAVRRCRAGMRRTYFRIDRAMERALIAEAGPIAKRYNLTQRQAQGVLTTAILDSAADKFSATAK